jgi:flagellin FlaB
MGKIKKILEKDVGSIGIGAMIVFIAMVLVAGIAASVLVQTANRLEIQAMTTGQDTEAEVATGIHVLDISGYGNGSGNDLWLMEIMIGPWAGAKEVDLSQTYVEISDTLIKNVLTYDSTEFHEKDEINGDLWDPTFFESLDGTDFGIIVIEDGDNSLS